MTTIKLLHVAQSQSRLSRRSPSSILPILVVGRGELCLNLYLEGKSSPSSFPTLHWWLGNVRRMYLGKHTRRRKKRKKEKKKKRKKEKHIDIYSTCTALP